MSSSRGASSRLTSDRPRAYKVLCVSALHPKASDDVVRDTLYREFKKYGDISVRVVLEPDERVAYVYFRNFDDASDARHSKSRIILFDKAAIVEPVYESRVVDAPSYSSSSSRAAARPRSITPPVSSSSYARYRSRSPVKHSDQYRDYRGCDYHHSQQPQHYSHYRDHYSRSEPYPSRSSRPLRGSYESSSRSYPSSHHGSAGSGPRHAATPSSRRPYEREHKKERFPNYLTHIPPEDDPMATRTLFAGNLELDITEEEMHKIFGRFGRLLDIDIKRPPPGTGNAFAFIRYENLDMAHRAKVELSGQYIGKFQCKIGYGKVNPTPKVWVGGLGSWCSESILWKEFDRFGAIKSIDFQKANSWAHILYESVDAAQAAVQEMRGFPLGGSDRRLRIDFADLEISLDRSNESEGSAAAAAATTSSSATALTENGGRRREDEEPSAWTSANSDDDRSELAGAQSVMDICRLTPKVWDGGLILKNSLFPTKLHLLDGDRQLADVFKDENDKPYLKITQRLRLDQSKLDDVTKRMTSSRSHAVFLAMASVTSLQHDSSDIQTRPLKNLIFYLKQKEAAGVVSMNYKDIMGHSRQDVLYCFPPCEYAYRLIRREARDLVEDSKEDFLVIVVVNANN